MAKYYNYITQNGKPAKAVLVRLYNTSGQLVDTTTTDKVGYYQFTNVPQGTYEIRYYGNRLTKSDWLYNVQIIDADDIASDTLSGLSIITQIIPSQYYVRNTTGSIDMTAYLYENSVEIDSSEIDGYGWLANGAWIGYSGVNQNTATITADQISGITRVSCNFSYRGQSFIAYVGLTDVLDGDTGSPGPAGEGTYAVSMTTNSGVVFKSSDGTNYTPEAIQLTTNFYKASSLVTPNDLIEYYWELNGSHIQSGFGADYSTYTITPAQVNGYAHLTCDVISGVNGPFTAEQTIVDVFDGTSYIPVFEPISGDTFLTDSTGAVKPASLVPRAALYKEGSLLDTADITYVWYRGTTGTTPIASGAVTASGVGNSYQFGLLYKDKIVINGQTYPSTFAPNTTESFKVLQYYNPTGKTYSVSHTYRNITASEDAYTANIFSPDGNVFSLDSAGTVYPTSIRLSGVLFQGTTALNTGYEYYTWYINDVITGVTSQVLTLTHDNIDTTASIKLEVTHSGTNFESSNAGYGPFFDTITVFDVQDGIDALYVGISSDNGFAFVSGLTGYDPSQITLSGTMYQGGTPVSAGLTYDWIKDNVSTGVTSSTYTINPEDINRSSKIVCDVTFGAYSSQNEVTVFNIGTGSSGDNGQDAWYAVPETFVGSAYLTYQSPNIGVSGLLYVGGTLIDDINVDYSWLLDSVEIGTSQTITVTTSDVDLSALLRCNITYSGVTRFFDISLFDATDSVELYRLTPKLGSSTLSPGYIQVSELRNHTGFTPVARGEVLVTGLNCTQGQIKSFGLEYAANGSSDFKQIASFNVNIASGTSFSNTFEFAGIPVISPNDILGETYDFRLYSYNAFGIPSLIWNTSDWTDEYFSDADVQFIGQNFFRYTVPELEVSDDGGQTWYSMSPNEGDIYPLKDMTVILRWRDVAARSSALTSLDLGSDYIENWDGYPIDSFSLSLDEIKSIKSYAVVGKIYLDRNVDYNETATASGIMGDGPGSPSGYYSPTLTSSDKARYISWRLLGNYEIDSPFTLTNDGYVYATVLLPFGRALSLHVYMLVDKAPVFVDDGSGKRKMKIGLQDKEFPIDG